jgi:hypothetical protein
MHNITTLSIMTIRIRTLDTMTLSKKVLRIETYSITPLSITYEKRKLILHRLSIMDIIVTLSIKKSESRLLILIIVMLNFAN